MFEIKQLVKVNLTDKTKQSITYFKMFKNKLKSFYFDYKSKDNIKTLKISFKITFTFNTKIKYNAGVYKMT